MKRCENNCMNKSALLRISKTRFKFQDIFWILSARERKKLKIIYFRQHSAQRSRRRADRRYLYEVKKLFELDWREYS
jgi:hypothetical protein